MVDCKAILSPGAGSPTDMAARPYRPNNKWVLRGLAATALAAAAFSGWVMGCLLVVGY